MSRNNYKKKYIKDNKRKSAWPLIGIVGGLLLILGAIFVFNQPAKPKAAVEVTGSPSLKVDKEKVDLGDVKLGQLTRYIFTAPSWKRSLFLVIILGLLIDGAGVRA